MNHTYFQLWVLLLPPEMSSKFQSDALYSHSTQGSVGRRALQTFAQKFERWKIRPASRLVKRWETSEINSQKQLLDPERWLSSKKWWLNILIRRTSLVVASIIILITPPNVFNRDWGGEIIWLDVFIMKTFRHLEDGYMSTQWRHLIKYIYFSL